MRSWKLLPVILGCSIFASSFAGNNNSHARIFSAGETAYRSFSEIISHKTDNSSDFFVFASKIENYSMTLQEDSTYYIVRFTLNNYRGNTVRGGGAEYKISKKNLHVADIVFFK